MKRAYFFPTGFLLAAVISVPAAPLAPKPPPQAPPAGIPVPARDQLILKSGVATLGREIETVRQSLRTRPAALELLPDVQIYHNAVAYALAHDIFYKTNEFALAGALLRQGMERLQQLKQGQAPWTSATGLVVRGYVSRIDGSVQPYGLVVPESFKPGANRKHRLDFWYHGRDNHLSELKFINDRQTKPGQFTPADTFVLHPYGRFCNANKFAGEVDTFEALAHARKHYPLDENRLTVRGFSMGGAAVWHLAAHHAGRWAAAAPGAGFSETAVYAGLFNKDPKPAWYEQKLWALYDATKYAGNLEHCPTIAYSGEVDKQKQAADMMATAMAAEGLELAHLIGEKMGHKYDQKSIDEINRRMDEIVAKGRDPVPEKIRFTTWTLRYNQMLWVTIDGLEQHWERARVKADIIGKSGITAVTENVAALTLDMPAGLCPLDPATPPKVTLDGRELAAPRVAADRSWKAHFRKVDGRWESVAAVEDNSLRKRHGLQGPIDDAFMDSFLMVKPTGKAMNEKAGDWIADEQAQAIQQWWRQFRGPARVKEDRAITDADIAEHNLVLWGDPASNQILARIMDKLPLEWDAQTVRFGGRTFPADRHVPVMIFPNPLNPQRYVVLNSGFTFSVFGPQSNSLQVPKLPDYAVLDITVPRGARFPAGVVQAGFFNEQWKLTAAAR
jgi:hypothetical protein